MEKRKFLIMTASIGAGHTQAAMAVRDALAEKFPDAEIHMLDFMDRRISVFNSMLKWLYLHMLDFVPNLYDVFYRISGGASGGTAARQLTAAGMYPVMARLLEKYRPDVLVCTHPFPEAAASLWKRMGSRELRLIAVLTDYSLHQIWVYPRVDAYFTATEEMRQGLISMGFAEEAVHACGIPVSSRIRQVPERRVIREALGVGAESRVVLLMGGGLGLGGIENTLDELESMSLPLTLFVIAGRNQELERRVAERAERSRQIIRVWGYTREVQSLMQASDILITKPGALTMSEAFALGLPMLLHEPIPGPETENAIYAETHGAAVWIHAGASLAAVLEDILQQPARLQAMSDAARACGKPDAASKIAAWL
ncbi:MAG: glycosyltransferase [Selenomonadaceae bacterium]|nr:glycosyltransferase [Selenomonadaceae bacterium]